MTIREAAERDRRRRRRLQKELAKLRTDLAEREVDLVAYERVLADMERRALSPFGGTQAITIVRICREATARQCELLRESLASREKEYGSIKEPA